MNLPLAEEDAKMLAMRILVVGPKTLTTLFLEALAAQEIPNPTKLGSGEVREVHFVKQTSNAQEAKLPSQVNNYYNGKHRNFAESEELMTKKRSWLGIVAQMTGLSDSEPARKKARVDIDNKTAKEQQPKSLVTIPSSRPSLTNVLEDARRTIWKVQTDEPLMREGVTLGFEDISGLSTPQERNKYIEDNWESFSCVIVLMDLVDGEDHKLHEESLRLARNLMKEKKEVPLVAICDTNSKDSDLDLQQLVEHKEAFLHDIFGTKCVLNPGQLPGRHDAPVLITTSLIDVKFYRMAFFMTLQDLGKPASKEVVFRIGQQQLGRIVWISLPDEDKFQEAHRIVHDPITFQAIMIEQQFDRLVKVLQCKLGSDEAALQKMKHEASLLSFAPMTLGCELQRFKFQLEGLQLRPDSLERCWDALKKQYWNRFVEQLDLRMKTFGAEGKVACLSSLMESLIEYHKFSETRGWGQECNKIKGTMNELLDGMLQIIVHNARRRQGSEGIGSGWQSFPPSEWQVICACLLATPFSKVFRQQFGERLGRLEEIQKEVSDNCIDPRRSYQRCSKPDHRRFVETGAQSVTTPRAWDLSDTDNWGHLVCKYCTFRSESRWPEGFVPKKGGIVDMSRFVQEYNSPNIDSNSNPSIASGEGGDNHHAVHQFASTSMNSNKEDLKTTPKRKRVSEEEPTGEPDVHEAQLTDHDPTKTAVAHETDVKTAVVNTENEQIAVGALTMPRKIDPSIAALAKQGEHVNSSVGDTSGQPSGQKIMPHRESQIEQRGAGSRRDGIAAAGAPGCRTSLNEPKEIASLSLADLCSQKHDLKQQLKQFDMNFVRKHGRLPVKAEKEIIRHLYEDYNDLKSQIAVLEARGRRHAVPDVPRLGVAHAIAQPPQQTRMRSQLTKTAHPESIMNHQRATALRSRHTADTDFSQSHEETTNPVAQSDSSQENQHRVPKNRSTNISATGGSLVAPHERKRQTSSISEDDAKPRPGDDPLHHNTSPNVAAKYNSSSERESASKTSQANAAVAPSATAGGDSNRVQPQTTTERKSISEQVNTGGRDQHQQELAELKHDSAKVAPAPTTKPHKGGNASHVSDLNENEAVVDGEHQAPGIGAPAGTPQQSRGTGAADSDPAVPAGGGGETLQQPDFPHTDDLNERSSTDDALVEDDEEASWKRFSASSATAVGKECGEQAAEQGSRSEPPTYSKDRRTLSEQKKEIHQRPKQGHAVTRCEICNLLFQGKVEGQGTTDPTGILASQVWAAVAVKKMRLNQEGGRIVYYEVTTDQTLPPSVKRFMKSAYKGLRNHYSAEHDGAPTPMIFTATKESEWMSGCDRGSTSEAAIDLTQDDDGE